MLFDVTSIQSTGQSCGILWWLVFCCGHTPDVSKGVLLSFAFAGLVGGLHYMLLICWDD